LRSDAKNVADDVIEQNPSQSDIKVMP